MTDWDAERFSFTPEEVERLAEMEHVRWMEERADSEDDGEANPHMVPWSELDEKDKDIDRRFIRKLPQLLARAGFQIVRLEGWDEAGRN